VPLALGAHTFEVRASDALGNVESPAASRAFTVAPKAVLTIVAAPVDVTRARIAAIELKCTKAAACRGTLTLELAGKAVGAHAFDIAAGRSPEIKVKLTAAAFKKLVRGGRLRVQAEAVYRQAGGGTTTARRTLTLRAP
jgi:uncharacterized membrane protein